MCWPDMPSGSGHALRKAIVDLAFFRIVSFEEEASLAIISCASGNSINRAMIRLIAELAMFEFGEDAKVLRVSKLMLSSGWGGFLNFSCDSEGSVAIRVFMSFMVRRMPRAAKKKNIPNPIHSQRSSILDGILLEWYLIHPAPLCRLPSRRRLLGRGCARTMPECKCI